ncbi:MAG TPA: N-acetylmuramoyl-L-alanine amidase [Acidobacteriaceae bacterium]|nr:N-acetylmuramoyl-L-alanine amidase [Acidobacteriaceae bacterium]
MRWTSEADQAKFPVWVFRLLVSRTMLCLLLAALTGTSAAQTVPSSTASSSTVPGSGGIVPGSGAANSAHSSPAPPEPASVAPARSTEPVFTVVLDAAHGGTDPGAVLGAAGPEKAYTLSLALRLQVLLRERGINSVLTRGADLSLASDARADIANRARASACILLHAAASGNGVHLFTSSLPPASPTPQDNHRAFLPWRTAQAGYVTQSLRLESDINTALAHDHIPALLGRTTLMPLDNLGCPAVAVEIAPPDAATSLASSGYEEQIAEAISSALAQWHDDRGQQP